MATFSDDPGFVVTLWPGLSNVHRTVPPVEISTCSGTKRSRPSGPAATSVTSPPPAVVVPVVSPVVNSGSVVSSPGVTPGAEQPASAPTVPVTPTYRRNCRLFISPRRSSPSPGKSTRSAFSTHRTEEMASGSVQTPDLEVEERGEGDPREVRREQQRRPPVDAPRAGDGRDDGGQQRDDDRKPARRPAHAEEDERPRGVQAELDDERAEREPVVVAAPDEVQRDAHQEIQRRPHGPEHPVRRRERRRPDGRVPRRYLVGREQRRDDARELADDDRRDQSRQVVPREAAASSDGAHRRLLRPPSS